MTRLFKDIQYKEIELLVEEGEEVSIRKNNCLNILDVDH